jgi:hypothetical protein
MSIASVAPLIVKERFNYLKIWLNMRRFNLFLQIFSVYYAAIMSEYQAL